MYQKLILLLRGMTERLNRYKEVVHEEVEHLAHKNIIANLASLAAEIQQGMTELGRLLK